jgi:hypothetical protein
VRLPVIAVLVLLIKVIRLGATDGGPRQVRPTPGIEQITRICTITDWSELGQRRPQVAAAVPGDERDP